MSGGYTNLTLHPDCLAVLALALMLEGGSSVFCIAFCCIA